MQFVWQGRFGANGLTIGPRSLFFIDHGGVLAALISGASRDAIWRQLPLKFEKMLATTL